MVKHFLQSLHLKPLLHKLQKKRSKEAYVLLICFFIYVAYFSIASFLRYDNFYTGRFDLGNMVQTVWNTTQGRFFLLTDPNSTEPISRLAFHADYMLVLLAPFYLVWPDARLLLLMQTLVLGAGCFFVYAISLRVLRDKTISLVLGVSYLLNPSIQRMNLYDFHAVALASTLLLASWYFILKKRYFLFILFAFLAAITKEQVWITTGLLGLFIALKAYLHKKELKNRDVLLGLSFFAVSAVFCYYFVWFAIPKAHGSQHFALEYFSDFGDSPGGIIKQILLSPGKTLSVFVQNDRLSYYRQIFAPLGFTSFLGLPLLGFVLHDFLINILSSNENLHQIYYQYTATLTPFLYLATIYGIFWLRKYVSQTLFSRRVIAIYFLISSLYATLLFSPLPWSKEPNVNMFTRPLANKAYVNAALKSIPEDASIASSNVLGSHLSNREKIYTVPNGTYDADYIALLLSDTSAQPSMQSHKELAARLRNNPNYILVASDGDFLLFRKRKLTVLYY